jgi:uncharacterized protein YegP (UPF0339 family)
MKYRILAAVFLTAAVCTVSLDAQGTKKKAPGSIEIVKNEDGDFRYRIKDAEGKVIAMPLPNKIWEKKADVLKALDELKLILNTVTPIDGKEIKEVKKAKS